MASVGPDRSASTTVRGSGTLAADVLAALEAHDGPGDVRELDAAIEAAIERAVLRDVADLTVEQLADRERVLGALTESAGNQTRAARRLGISRTTLVTKLRVYRIPRPRT